MINNNCIWNFKEQHYVSGCLTKVTLQKPTRLSLPKRDPKWYPDLLPSGFHATKYSCTGRHNSHYMRYFSKFCWVTKHISLIYELSFQERIWQYGPINPLVCDVKYTLCCGQNTERQVTVMALNSGAKGINSSPICPRRKATCSTYLNWTELLPKKTNGT
jgi:hypothetical protein